MHLKFLGRGSAFNVEEGNNNAFYKNSSGQMLLIDCGETAFAKIKDLGLLNGVNQLFVAITHTHSDHFGSLGSLILYAYFNLNLKISLLLTGDKKQDKLLKYMIKNFGIHDEFINYISTKKFVENMIEFKDFYFVKTPHDLILNTFGIVYETVDGITYYSSDTNCDKLLKEYLLIENLDKIYIDTSYQNNEGNTHLSFDRLKESVSIEKRHKVYAMHIDDIRLIKLLEEEGFNLVEIYKVY